MAKATATATSASGGNNGDTISGGNTNLWPLAIVLGVVALIWFLAKGKRRKK